jgi:ubiquinone/menaquinone biosynthesis C-methylase UbiE
MFRWFRAAPRIRETAIAMVDPRPGDDVLFVGATHPALAGETGAITGLNGRTVVVDAAPEAGTRIDEAARKAGALVEFSQASFARLPFDPVTFKVIVIPALETWPGEAWAPALAEAMRVARPGARIILLAGRRQGRLARALRPARPALAPDSVLTALTRAGAIAGRRLAESDGVQYFEARKPR